MNFFVTALILIVLIFQMSFANTQNPPLPISLDNATKKVLEEHGKDSKLLSAKTTQEKEKKFHLIKILTDEGQILQIEIDVKTGKELDDSSDFE